MWMMKRTLKYLMIVLFSTAFILGMDIHPVSAQESPQEPPPFEFAQTDTLSLSWEDLQEQSAGAEVLNNRTNELKLTVKLSSLEPVDPEGEPLDPSQVLEYDPSLTLPSAGSAMITINADETRPAPGVYDGSLTVSQASLDTVARRSVQLTVEDPQAKGAATPLVDKWRVRAYHWVPVLGKGLDFFDWPVPLSEQFLPLDVEAADANNVDPMRGERLGVVTGSQGGAGVVTSTGETKELLSGTPALKLGFAGLRRPGTYEGQVDFNPDDEDTVALTIDVKDVILWPILALGFGIWLARWVKRYINKGRKVWTLGERTDRLAVNFYEAQERFAKDTQGKPYASYTISQDMSRRRYDLAHNLKRLNNSALVTLDESDESYKAVVEELDKLEAAVKDWKALGGELVVLDKALRTAKDRAATATSPPLSRREQPYNSPAFLPEARKLLIGTRIPIDALKPLRERVNKTTGLADSWGRMNDAVVSQHALIEELERRRELMSDTQVEQLDKAEGVVSETWWELWSAKDADELQRRQTELDLSEAEKSLAQLRHFLRERVLVDSEERRLSIRNLLNVDGLNQIQDVITSLDSNAQRIVRPEPVRHAAVRAETYARARRRWDFLLAWLAFVLALVTGLNTLYIGKPFGTLWDYVSAVAWGVGAVLALDALSAAVEKLPNIRELIQSR